MREMRQETDEGNRLCQGDQEATRLKDIEMDVARNISTGAYLFSVHQATTLPSTSGDGWLQTPFSPQSQQVCNCDIVELPAKGCCRVLEVLLRFVVAVDGYPADFTERKIRGLVSEAKLGGLTQTHGRRALGLSILVATEEMKTAP
jgi:hypothetical protein